MRPFHGSFDVNQYSSPSTSVSLSYVCPARLKDRPYGLLSRSISPQQPIDAKGLGDFVRGLTFGSPLYNFLTKFNPKP